jgi:glycosyltransferase involved in cell wall biosynthesis
VSKGNIKLTYLITGLQFGGANVGMVRLLSELSPDEFDVTVVSVAQTEKDVIPLLPDHVKLVQCDVENTFTLHRLTPLIPVLRETDVLVCSLFHATAVGTVFERLIRVPTVLVWHHNTAHRNRIRTTIYGYANWVADRVLADSATVKQMLIDEFGISESDISVLPIAGVDTELFAPSQSDANTGTDDIKVATVGRLTEQKGYTDLLECARRLVDTLQFHIAGTGPQQTALERDAPPNVHFHKKIPDDELPKFYATADIYFQPSRWEGLCMTVIEAMSCGLPIVASTVGGISESVVPGKTGFLCPPRDIDCFCDRLTELADDPDIRQTMGEAGRNRIKDRYSANVLGNAFRTAVAQAHEGDDSTPIDKST